MHQNRRKQFSLPVKYGFLLSCCLWAATIPVKAQINSTTPWIWMHGDNSGHESGVYGVAGVAAPGNKPGARTMPVNWTAPDGKLWLFGGYGDDASAAYGRLSDLWSYDLKLNQWIWMTGDTTVDQTGRYGTRGVASPSNKPGARSGSARWVDTSGNLWLFGGYGFGASNSVNLTQNDLWKFDPSAKSWTWMGGDSAGTSLNGVYGSKGVAATTNRPGARNGAVSWRDKAGNFWLFGGEGNAASGYAGFLNDLWKYNPYSGQWTWISGDTLIDQNSVYGTSGVPAAGNKPGARAFASGWADTAGNLWFLGGEQYGSFYNDLWRFNIQAQQWTWMNGDNRPDQNGIYGTKDVTSATSKPGARFGAASWSDNYNNFYLLGGISFPRSGSEGYTNDFWKYDPSINNWTWINGDSVINVPGVYGTIKQEDPKNMPGSRNMSAYWTDQEGQFWLLGGDGYASGGRPTVMNDLWKLKNCIKPLQPQSIKGAAAICVGNSNIYSVDPVEWATSYTWTLPNGWTGSSTGNTITVVPGNTGGSIRVTANSSCDSSLAQTLTIAVGDPKAVINTEGFTLGTTGTFASYQWLLNNQELSGATQSKYAVKQNGNYRVIVTDEHGCTDTSDVYSVNNYTGIKDPGLKAQQVKMFPNPAREKVFITAPFAMEVTLTSVEGRVLKAFGRNDQVTVEGLVPGIYLVRVADDKGNWIKTVKLVKE